MSTKNESIERETNLGTEVEDDKLTPQMPPKTIASLLFFPFAALLFLIVLIVFEVMQIVCECFGKKGAWVGRQILQRGFIYYLYTLGTKIEIDVATDLECDKAYIFVSNHQSMFDIPLLYYAFGSKEPRYISKVELGKGIPTISRYLKSSGSALIERDNPRQALPAIKKLAKQAEEENFGIAMFPEGTRARDGRLKKFRPSGLKILFQNAPDAVVMPVAIDGSWKFTCYPKGPIPLGVKVSVKSGNPIDREGKSTDELVAECEQEVRRLLAEIRTDSSANA